MDRLEEITQDSVGVRFPENIGEPTTVTGSENRTQAPPTPVSSFESIWAGLRKNGLLNIARELDDREHFYMPDDAVDISKHPELYKDLPEDDQITVLSSTSIPEAQDKRDAVLERIKETRTQYANGMTLGLLGEFGGYFDPVSLSTGATFIESASKIPKALRATKTIGRMIKSGRAAEIATGALATGAFSAGEESVRQYGHPEADTEGVVYAAAAGMALGAGVTALLTRQAKHVPNTKDLMVIDQPHTTDMVLSNIDVGVPRPIPPYHAPKQLTGTLALPDPILEMGHTIKNVEPIQYKQITYTGGDPVVELGVHIDNSTAKLGASIENTLDEKLVIDPEEAARPHNIPDESYDVTGSDIDVEGLDALDDTLTQNFTPREKQMHAKAKQLVEDGDTATPEDLKMYKKIAEKDPTISDGLRGILSKSNMAKVISSHFGELATGVRGKVTTTATGHKGIFEAKTLWKMNTALRKAKVEFLGRHGIKPRNFIRFNGSGRKMFGEEVALEMGRRHSGIKSPHDIDPAIKAAADELDDVLKNSLEELQNAGWKGAEEVKFKKGAMPLIWDGAAMSKLVQAGRSADVIALLQKSYTNVGFSPELSKRLADAVFNRSLSRAASLDFNPAALFTKAGRGDLERMLRETNASELDIAGIMKLVDKETSNMPKRTNIDLTTEHNGIRTIDLINTDVEDVMSRYVQRTGGQIGIAKKGAKSYDDIDSMLKIAKAQAAMAGEDAEVLGKSLGAIFDELLARPVNGGVSRGVRRALDYSIVTKLGGLVFPQIAEFQSIAAAHGLLNTIKAVPAATKLYTQLTKAAKTGDFSKLDKPFLEELQVLAGQMYDEHLLYRTGIHLDENMDAGMWGIMDNINAVAIDAMGSMSGMYRVKGIQQVMALMLQTDKVAKLVKGKLSTSKIKRLSDLGWNENVINKIKAEVDKHGEWNKGTIDRLNLEKWDTLTRAEFVQGMHRHVNQVIQLGKAGEGRYWMHTNTAALMLQFRSFPLTAIEKHTGRHLINADSEAVAALMYGAAFSSVATLMKAYVESIGRSDRKKVLKRAMEPASLIRGSINYNTALSMISDATGSAMKAFGYGAGGRWGTSMTPPLISGAQRGMSGISDYLQGKPSERSFRNAVSLGPVMSTPQAKILTNILGDTIHN